MTVADVDLHTRDETLYFLARSLEASAVHLLYSAGESPRAWCPSASCKISPPYFSFFLDPTLDTKLEFDGKEVAVPQGTPLQQGKWSQSSFSQSEYLVYKESQARIRYLLKLKF